MSEASFQPYFQKTMDTLILAGKLSVQMIDLSLPIDDQKGIHDLRQALIEAFLSIINGIKSPSLTDHSFEEGGEGVSAPSNSFEDLTFESIKNMFFYTETLLSLDDLSLNQELARQILALYCDITMLQMQDQQTACNQARTL